MQARAYFHCNGRYRSRATARRGSGNLAAAPRIFDGPPWGSGAPIWSGAPAARAARLEEWYEERAAIMEYDGGLPRAFAEHEAYRLLAEGMQARQAG